MDCGSNGPLFTNSFFTTAQVAEAPEVVIEWSGDIGQGAWSKMSTTFTVLPTITHARSWLCQFSKKLEGHQRSGGEEYSNGSSKTELIHTWKPLGSEAGSGWSLWKDW